MHINLPDIRPASVWRWRVIELIESAIRGCAGWKDHANPASDVSVGFGARMIGPIRVDWEFGSESPHGFYSTVVWARIALLGVMFDLSVEAFDSKDAEYAPLYGSSFTVSRSKEVFG